VKPPVHYYHAFAGGPWPQPAGEHAAALRAAKFHGDITVGMVGDPADRSALRGVLKETMAWPCLPVFLEWDAGYEQLTLSAMRQWARDAPADTPVLYCHTKGTFDNSEWNAMWRRSMTHHVVGRWRECVRLLEDGYDTVGCHWLTPERDAGPARPVTTPMYGGNFWWATSQYLATLPEPGTEYRHQAEEWVGLNGPKAYDLLPGWPTPDLCGPYAEGPESCSCPRCRAVRKSVRS